MFGILFCAVCPAFGTPDSTKRSKDTIRIVAVGDMCFARGVEQAASKAGPSYPFERMLSALQQADIAFGNLECALTAHRAAVPKRYNFRASPTWAAKLAKAGFDVVSVANNHSQDFGSRGLADTVTSLTRAGVVPVGGGLTMSEARSPRVVARKGVRVAFLAYLGMFPPVLPILASGPSVAMAEPASMRADIAAARKKADVVVVSLHAGVEMVTTPSRRQKSLAAEALRAGADVVLGHHPHVVQPVERHHGKVIFYSLGNFVFNPSPSFLRNPRGPWAAMADIRVSRRGVTEATLVPLLIVDRQPRPRKR